MCEITEEQQTLLDYLATIGETEHEDKAALDAIANFKKYSIISSREMEIDKDTKDHIYNCILDNCFDNEEEVAEEYQREWLTICFVIVRKDLDELAAELGIDF